jgi:hypothetical protein
MLFSYLVIWVTKYLVVWLFGYSGDLNNQIFGYSVIQLFGSPKKTEFGDK